MEKTKIKHHSRYHLHIRDFAQECCFGRTGREWEGGSGEGGVMEGGDDGSLSSLIYIDGIKTTPLSGEAMHLTLAAL